VEGLEALDHVEAGCSPDDHVVEDAEVFVVLDGGRGDARRGGRQSSVPSPQWPEAGGRDGWGGVRLAWAGSALGPLEAFHYRPRRHVSDPT